MDAPEQEAKKPGFFKKVNQFVGGFFKGAPESTPQSPVQAVPVAEYAGIKVGDKVTAIVDKTKTYWYSIKMDQRNFRFFSFESFTFQKEGGLLE